MVLRALLDTTFVGYPKVPNSETGRTVPYEVKRSLVYITDTQGRILTVVWWAQIGSGCLILICLILNEKWLLRQQN
jgi:hypothetical protein